MSVPSRPLRATVNCDMGEVMLIYRLGDDESLIKTIHLANIACGFHASDFSVMNKTVVLAKTNNVLVGAHPSLPDLQGFGRREMAVEPDELASCYIYQVGALVGFLKRHGLPLNHIKPHGAVYGQTARSIDLARVVVGVAKVFNGSAARPDAGVAFMGLAGTTHQQAAEELGVPFIADNTLPCPFPSLHIVLNITDCTNGIEWFADLDYSDEGKLLITKDYRDPRKHDSVPIGVLQQRVKNLLDFHVVTTVSGKPLPIGPNVSEVSICCHSDTPGAVEIARLVKACVDQSNKEAGYV
ncbi:lamb YcsF family protein [Imleria badia]|nr:lamb YcsF family protein [Imleria badia]